MQADWEVVYKGSIKRWVIKYCSCCLAGKHIIWTRSNWNPHLTVEIPCVSWVPSWHICTLKKTDSPWCFQFKRVISPRMTAPSRHGNHEDSTGSHCWCQWERWLTHWSDWNEGERSKPCLQVTSWSFVLQLHTSSWNPLMMKEFGCVKAMMPVQTQHVSSSIPIISKKSGWCERGGCVGQIHCSGHHFSGHRNWRSTVATCPTTPCHNRQGSVCCWRRERLHHTWAIPHLLWPWFRFFRPFILPGMQWSQSVVLKRSQLRIFIMKGTRTESKGKLVACVVVVRSSAESLPGYTTSRKASSRMCASWFFHTFCWSLWLQLVKAMVWCTSNGLPCTAT